MGLVSLCLKKGPSRCRKAKVEGAFPAPGSRATAAFGRSRTKGSLVAWLKKQLGAGLGDMFKDRK